MHTALLVDDEAVASQRLSQLLRAHPEIDVVGTARSVAEAREFLVTHAPEIVFLDMEMPGGQGIDLLPDLRDGTQVVFATAHPEYAVAAFDVGAIDYLLKPIDPDRLETAVERVLRPLGHRDRPKAAGERDDGIPDEEAEHLLWLPTHGNRGRARIATTEVLWVESMGNYTRVGLAGRPRPVVFRIPLSKWAARLPTRRFGQISRSLIVQFGALRNTTWKSRNETLLAFEGGGEPLVVGRTAAARLRNLLAS